MVVEELDLYYGRTCHCDLTLDVDQFMKRALEPLSDCLSIDLKDF